jgi:hypothetical protein
MKTSSLGKLAGVVTLLTGLTTAQAQVVIFSENFDPLSAGGVVQDGYHFGDTTAHSSGVVAGIGVSGTSGWETVNTAASGANGYSGVGAQYQDGTASGNTSLNKSDYTLSFDARATGGSLNIQFQTWDGQHFGGTFNGTLATASDLALTPGYSHYSISLGTLTGSLTGLGLTGGTIQVGMQFDAGGATPYSYTMDIDNFSLTMVPEPSSLALCAMGAAGGFAMLRRRKA